MTKIKVRRKRIDGRRQRRRQRHQVTVAIAAASCLFILCIISLICRRGEKKSTVRLGQRLGQPNYKKTKIRRNSAGRRNDLLDMRGALEDPDSDPVATEQARAILSASVNLVDIDFGSHTVLEDDSYRGIVAEFCAINFSTQKESPSDVPMFRDVVKASPGCGEGTNIRVDLRESVELTRDFDVDNADINPLPAILDLRGVVFHESRCGSTLAANSMMALNPQKHRVYSESSPPLQAMKACGEGYHKLCSVEAAANLLKDVIYIMGRSNDPREENLFFKFQSITTRSLETFRAAFPTTPWIFMYREPVEVLASQLNVPGGRISKANCVRSKSSPMIRAFIDKSEYHFDDLIDEEFCAIHLATLCESALKNIEDAEGLGMAVNYSPDLVYDFLDVIFPQHFRTPVDDAGRGRVLNISSTYSKNRGRKNDEEFKPDSQSKERFATEEMKNAAKDFLEESFHKLEKSEHNIRPSDEDDESA